MSSATQPAVESAVRFASKPGTKASRARGAATRDAVAGRFAGIDAIEIKATIPGHRIDPALARYGLTEPAAAATPGFLAFLAEVGAERDREQQQAKTRWALGHHAARLRQTA